MSFFLSSNFSYISSYITSSFDLVFLGFLVYPDFFLYVLPFILVISDFISLTELLFFNLEFIFISLVGTGFPKMFIP